jgi:hypothetical protein
MEVLKNHKSITTMELSQIGIKLDDIDNFEEFLKENKNI